MSFLLPQLFPPRLLSDSVKQGYIPDFIFHHIKLPDGAAGNPVLRQIIMSVKASHIIRSSAAHEMRVDILIFSGCERTQI